MITITKKALIAIVAAFAVMLAVSCALAANISRGSAAEIAARRTPAHGGDRQRSIARPRARLYEKRARWERSIRQRIRDRIDRPLPQRRPDLRRAPSRPMMRPTRPLPQRPAPQPRPKTNVRSAT